MVFTFLRSHLQKRAINRRLQQLRPQRITDIWAPIYLVSHSGYTFMQCPRGPPRAWWPPGQGLFKVELLRISEGINLGEKVVVFTGQWFVQKVIDSIIPIILSTGVSLFANKTIIQRSQKKRLHSKTINHESFKPWNDMINDLCSIGVYMPLIEYSHDEKRIVPSELEQLDSIPHHTYLESHMKTGYPQIWESWGQLRLKSQIYFQAIADVNEVIREQIIEDSKDLGLLEYYHQYGRITPRECIQPVKMAAQIYTEINNRLQGIDDWLPGKPLKTSASYPDGNRIYQMNIHNQTDILGDSDEEIIDAGIRLVLNFVENDEYKKEIIKIRKMFDEIIDVRDRCQKNIGEITSKIDLVNDVKGQCEAC